ncbi:MAG: hypothetical protein ACWA5Q_10265 [bacterium]
MAQAPKRNIPGILKCSAVLWPSFLTAAVVTGIFFSAFDPKDLIPFNWDIDISPLGVYTMGFFFFWAITAISGIGTFYFAVTNCLNCKLEDEDELEVDVKE